MGATSARRRQRGGLYSRRFSLSTPLLKFRISSLFQRFRWLRRHRVGAASSAVGGLYGRPSGVSTAQNDDSDIFRRSHSPDRFPHLVALYSTGARGLSLASRFAGVQAAPEPPNRRRGDELSSPPAAPRDARRRQRGAIDGGGRRDCKGGGQSAGRRALLRQRAGGRPGTKFCRIVCASGGVGRY